MSGYCSTALVLHSPVALQLVKWWMTKRWLEYIDLFGKCRNLFLYFCLLQTDNNFSFIKDKVQEFSLLHLL